MSRTGPRPRHDLRTEPGSADNTPEEYRQAMNLLESCRFLLESDSEAADAALLDALPHAGPDELDQIIDVLLRRARRPGLIGVVTQFHRLGDAIQATVINQFETLTPAIREALRAPQTQTRLNVVDIASRNESLGGAPLLSTAIEDSSRRVRERAAGALHELANGWHRHHRTELSALSWSVTNHRLSTHDATGRVRKLNDERQTLLMALEESLLNFERHCITSMLAPIMWFITPMGARAWSRISASRSRAGHAMIETLARDADPRSARFALLAMLHTELRSSIAQTLAATRSDPFVHALIREAWLTADPRCRTALQRIRSLAWLNAGTDKILSLPEPLQLRLIRLITALGTTAESKAAIYHDLLRNGTSAVRRAALWAIVDLEGAATTQVLNIIASGSDAPLATIAQRELRRRGCEPQCSARAPKPPSVPKVERNAPPASTPVTFEQFWDEFHDLSETARHDWVRRMTYSGVNLKAELRRRILSGSPTEQVRAISMAAETGLIDAYRTEIYRLAHEPEVLVRAAAISVLPMLPGPTTERMLAGALTDSDGRVQANAVTAINAVGGEDCVELLRPKLDADNNRVRANAIHSLIRYQVREAAEGLLLMLTNPDRASRLSALWVADRLMLSTLLPRLQTMAREDPDPQIRTRAAELASRMGGSVEPLAADAPPAETAR